MIVKPQKGDWSREDRQGLYRRLWVDGLGHRPGLRAKRRGVTLCDVNQEALAKAKKAIAWSVGKFVEKGKVSGTVEEIMGRVSFGVSWPPAPGIRLSSRPSSRTWS